VAGDLGNKVTDIDGNVYKTAAIGAQVRMAENRRVTRCRVAVQQKSDTPLTKTKLSKLRLNKKPCRVRILLNRCRKAQIELDFAW